MLNRRGLGACLIAVSCFLFLFAPLRHMLCTGFLPPNSMKIPVGLKQDGGITHEQYDEVMDRLEAIYTPIVAAKGGRLEINRLWEDPTVNSQTGRRGKVWHLDMFGGLARHPAMTQDGEALVACHEMAHQLGGAPKIGRVFGWFGSWATNEGQSDYAATLKCMRLMFADQASASFTRARGADPVVQEACEKAHRSPRDRALCERIAMSGLSLAGLLSSLNGGGDPHFDTPDRTRVKKTSDEHPAAQCRLDTYFQGALCAQSVSMPLSDHFPAYGTCTRSQGYLVGMRPLCWYKPPITEPADLIIRMPVGTDVQKAVLKSKTFSTLKNGPLWP